MDTLKPRPSFQPGRPREASQKRYIDAHTSVSSDTAIIRERPLLSSATLSTTSAKVKFMVDLLARRENRHRLLWVGTVSPGDGVAVGGRAPTDWWKPYDRSTSYSCHSGQLRSP